MRIGGAYYFVGAFSICICVGLGAQGYHTATGVRFGENMGFTIQQRVGKKVTLEGIAQYHKRYEESAVSLLVESHTPILFRKLNVYTGLGPHYTWSQIRETPAKPGAGVTLVAGLEVTIGRMNISWDYKPLIHLTGDHTGFHGQSAVSVRYVLIKRRNQNKVNLKFWEPKNGSKKKQQKRKRMKRRKRNRSM